MEIKNSKKLGNELLDITQRTNHDIDIVKQLIANGANLNVSNELGYTPLIFAVWLGNIDTEEVLVKAGANVNQADTEGKIALHFVSYSCQQESVELLLENGSNINSIDKYGRTPFYLMVSNGQYQMLPVMVKAGANIEFPDSRIGDTPLHRGVRCNKTEPVCYLVSIGANVNSFNNCGDTPMHQAAINKNITIVRILMKAGADLYAENNLKATPLDYLIESRFNKKLIEEIKEISRYNIATTKLNKEDLKQFLSTEYNFDI